MSNKPYRTLDELLRNINEETEQETNKITIPDELYTYADRTACAVLQEMRQMNEKLSADVIGAHKVNTAYMIEELQCFYNRMESALESQRSLYRIQEKGKKLKLIYNKLRKECLAMKQELKKNDK